MSKKCWFNCGKDATEQRKLGIVTVDVCSAHSAKTHLPVSKARQTASQPAEVKP